MNTHEISKKIELLLAACDDGNDECVREVLDQFNLNNLLVELDLEENTRWETIDDFRYPTVRVEYTLKVGSCIISQWWADYIGEQLGCGSSMFITQVDSECEHDLDLVLELSHIYIDSPCVPMPEKIS